jgi:dipeptidyl aminopeptidase/acylaminoacyl peptidase
VRLRDATFSPTGPLLAMVGADGRIGVLNTDTDRYERHLQVPAAPIWAIAFSAGGDRIATANDDDTVAVWYHPTGHQVHTLVPHRGRVRSIAFSPDGSLIATGCDDSEVRLWDAASGELLRTLSGHDDRVYAVSFGRGQLASASWDGSAIVWDLRSGAGQPLPRRHTGRLWATAFHPSGALLATAGDDLGIRLWTRDGAEYGHLQTLPGHTRGVTSLAFSPTGDLLASGGEDGTARLWTVEDDHVTRRGTLLGLPEGWATLGPDNRYKTDGTVRGEFWHVIGTCRFELGELEGLISEVRHMPATGPM